MLLKKLSCADSISMVGSTPDSNFGFSNLARYGISKETTKSKNLQAQTPQANEGEPPQETLALQSLIPRAVSR